jgi:hydrogenase-1 operon protein HyaF
MAPLRPGLITSKWAPPPAQLRSKAALRRGRRFRLVVTLAAGRHERPGDPDRSPGPQPTLATGDQVHVINLTLLPLSEQDLPFSTPTCPPARARLGPWLWQLPDQRDPDPELLAHHVLQLQDAQILDTIEITDLPEVICAAPKTWPTPWSALKTLSSGSKGSEAR